MLNISIRSPSDPSLPAFFHKKLYDRNHHKMSLILVLYTVLYTLPLTRLYIPFTFQFLSNFTSLLKFTPPSPYATTHESWRKYAYIHVIIYAHLYTRTHFFTYTHTHTHTHTHVVMPIHTYTYRYIRSTQELFTHAPKCFKHFIALYS